MSRTVRKSDWGWDVKSVYPNCEHGTGPLACLSLPPVEYVDKESNDLLLSVQAD